MQASRKTNIKLTLEKLSLKHLEHLMQLLSGHTISQPIYDYKMHTRLEETRTAEPHVVIILEGILIFQKAQLRELMGMRVFIETALDVCFIRRLKRDIADRGRSTDSVVKQYLNTVRPMHLQFVEPSKRYADIVIPEGYNLGAVGTVISAIRDVLRDR